jgi:hypothetical protein
LSDLAASGADVNTAVFTVTTDDGHNIRSGSFPVILKLD